MTQPPEFGEPDQPDNDEEKPPAPPTWAPPGSERPHGDPITGRGTGPGAGPGTGPGAGPGAGTPPPGYPPPGYPPPPDQPQQGWGRPAPGPATYLPLTPDQERSWSMWSHLAALLIGLAGGIVTCGLLSLFAWVFPLVVMQTIGSRSPVVRVNAVESLNFQLSILLYGLCLSLFGTVFGAITFGIGWLLVLPAIIAVVVAEIVLVCIASSRASAGGLYRYPVTIRFAH